MNSFTCISAFLCVAASAVAEVTVVNRGGALRQPFSIDIDWTVSPHQLVGVEYEEGNRVFSVSSEGGEVRFVAGQGGKGGKKLGDVAIDSTIANQARFNGMHDLARTVRGVTYIADTFNNRIRMIGMNGQDVSTYAGVGGSGGFGGDGGPADKARFDGPYTVTLSPDDSRLLVADLGNRRVREIDLRTNIIRTVAGNGERGVPRDRGIALEEPLVAPRAACYGADGKTIYIASREGHALREVAPDGTIRTVVNPEGKKGYAGDGGSGLKARLNGPKHLCLDPDGNIVIADDQNHCIRVYRPAAGTIHLLAGTPGTSGTAIGTGRLDTQLNRPHGARYDRDGTLYVADSMNHRILRFTKD